MQEKDKHIAKQDLKIKRLESQLAQKDCQEEEETTEATDMALAMAGQFTKLGSTEEGDCSGLWVMAGRVSKAPPIGGNTSEEVRTARMKRLSNCQAIAKKLEFAVAQKTDITNLVESLTMQSGFCNTDEWKELLEQQKVKVYSWIEWNTITDVQQNNEKQKYDELWISEDWMTVSLEWCENAELDFTTQSMAHAIVQKLEERGDTIKAKHFRDEYITKTTNKATLTQGDIDQTFKTLGVA